MDLGVRVEITSGDAVQLNCSVIAKTGLPLNISGLGVKFDLYNVYDEDDESVLTKESIDITQIDIFAPVSGQFKIFLTPADTEVLNDLYKYYIRLIEDAKPYTIKKGSFFVDPKGK